MPAMTMGSRYRSSRPEPGRPEFERVKEVVRWSILMTVGIGVVSLVALVFRTSPQYFHERSELLRKASDI